MAHSSTKPLSLVTGASSRPGAQDAGRANVETVQANLAANVLPETATAALHHSMAEPGSAKK